jgi:hypothetical protein
MRWTMQVCTIVGGNTAAIASGNPFRPSRLDWIEVCRVGGQEEELGFGRADGGANGAALMAAEVVHDVEMPREIETEREALPIAGGASPQSSSSPCSWP